MSDANSKVGLVCSGADLNIPPSSSGPSGARYTISAYGTLWGNHLVQTTPVHHLVQTKTKIKNLVQVPDAPGGLDSPPCSRITGGTHPLVLLLLSRADCKIEVNLEPPSVLA